jgi:F-type H+-transporting ATPase subunit b
MLEVNGWFFVQLANFLILLFLLNTILFKPLMKLFKERADNTQGALDSANAMGREKDGVLAQIEGKLSGARTEARSIFENLSNEGLEVQKSSVQSAQNESIEINKKARVELEAATDKARNALKSDIEAFSKQIVDKLVRT